tara:strand:+ start:1856 stop:2062 length:207 start_codon:yes stop_codon:yes gene_type:complete
MKKYDGKNSVEMTAEEEAVFNECLAEDKVMDNAFKQAQADKEALKDSAKAKLVAGEALTQEEADTIVL